MEHSSSRRELLQRVERNITRILTEELANQESLQGRVKDMIQREFRAALGQPISEAVAGDRTVSASNLSLSTACPYQQRSNEVTEAPQTHSGHDLKDDLSRFHGENSSTIDPAELFKSSTEQQPPSEMAGDDFLSGFLWNCECACHSVSCQREYFIPEPMVLEQSSVTYSKSVQCSSCCLD